MALREDQLKWDRRYREGEGEAARPEPHPLGQRWGHLWTGGAMIDAACGRGRGIATAGHAFSPIYAVDLSAAGIAQARRLWADRPGIRWIVGDVGALAWPRAAFGLICAFGFTDLPFFRRVPQLLRAGGMFLYEGFAPRQREVKPELNPAWIGEPAELRAIFSAGRVLELAESDEPPYRTRMAAVVG